MSRKNTEQLRCFGYFYVAKNLEGGFHMNGVDIFVGVMIVMVIAAFVWVWWLDNKTEK